VPGGFGFSLGFVAGIGVTLIAVAAGAAGHPLGAVVALMVAVAAVSAATTFFAAAGTALVCWCLADGFVIGRHGDLVFTSASLFSAVVLGSAALAAWAAAVLIRTARERTAVAEAEIPAQRDAAESVPPVLSMDEWGTW
jgi:hypothetical protein